MCSTHARTRSYSDSSPTTRTQTERGVLQSDWCTSRLQMLTAQLVFSRFCFAPEKPLTRRSQAPSSQWHECQNCLIGMIPKSLCALCKDTVPPQRRPAFVCPQRKVLKRDVRGAPQRHCVVAQAQADQLVYSNHKALSQTYNVRMWREISLRTYRDTFWIVDL